jgi:hypothetical protein
MVIVLGLIGTLMVLTAAWPLPVGRYMVVVAGLILLALSMGAQ